MSDYLCDIEDVERELENFIDWLKECHNKTWLGGSYIDWFLEEKLPKKIKEIIENLKKAKL
jgi:hypothetical protein